VKVEGNVGQVKLAGAVCSSSKSFKVKVRSERGSDSEKVATACQHDQAESKASQGFRGDKDLKGSDAYM
jgi:hypothetical protein